MRSTLQGAAPLHEFGANLPEVKVCVKCKLPRGLHEFKIRHDGRVKSICSACTQSLIATFGIPADAAWIPLRKCHDCGKPTANYRCKRCWNARRDPEWEFWPEL